MARTLSKSSGSASPACLSSASRGAPVLSSRAGRAEKTLGPLSEMPRVPGAAVHGGPCIPRTRIDPSSRRQDQRQRRPDRDTFPRLVEGLLGAVAGGWATSPDVGQRKVVGLPRLPPATDPLWSQDRPAKKTNDKRDDELFVFSRGVCEQMQNAHPTAKNEGAQRTP